ncbi:MAG TPA: hypothetical protein VFL36_19115 [Myxococcales bacterium]|nr:hypothetical protein [Myxococcales bacterium]
MTPTRIGIAMCLAMAACGGTQARDAVTVSGRLSASGGQPLASGAAGVQVADGITLSRARIAVRDLRVESKSDGAEVKLSEGPLLIDVSGNSLSGALLQLATANVPAGTYDKLKIDVHRAQAPAPASFDDLMKQNASVLLEGDIDGTAFTFASSLEAEVEHEGTFTLGDAASSNITLDLDASKWFTAADGSRLDPRDPTARSAIEGNIRASFGAFEDDNHDGMDDHGDDHGHDAADAGDDHGGNSGPGGGQDGGSSGPGSGQDGGSGGPGSGQDGGSGGGGSDDPSGHH